MKSLSILLTGAAFLCSVNYASALPIEHITAKPSAILVICKPGTKNCIKAGPNIPKRCNPCEIDSGLGSTCKGGGTCGIGTGDKVNGGSKVGSVAVGAGAKAHSHK